MIVVADASMNRTANWSLANPICSDMSIRGVAP